MPVAIADAAPCACKRFAWNFNRQPKAQLVFQMEADARGVSRRMQYRIRRGICDWEVGGYVSLERESFWKWCGRTAICRKLRNCIINGGTAYLVAKYAGVTEDQAMFAAAATCAAAVATTP